MFYIKLDKIGINITVKHPAIPIDKLPIAPSTSPSSNALLVPTAWAAGELVSQFIKNIISIPGSILGMIILFLLLQFKVISEEKIKDVADFLLGNMGIFFIPAGVSLIQSLGLIKENAILLLSCIILINIAVMIGCGKSVDFMIKLKEKKETKSKQEIA